MSWLTLIPLILEVVKEGMKNLPLLIELIKGSDEERRQKAKDKLSDRLDEANERMRKRREQVS